MLKLFQWFENRIAVYPEEPNTIPPDKLVPFVWWCTRGVRPYLLMGGILTAVISLLEATLYNLMGHMVDWLSRIAPAQLWAQESGRLQLLIGILIAGPFVTLAYTLVVRQSVLANFPMRLRWKFHRLLLAQSLSFYQDEFAGRVSAKLMQTALAVRDTCIIFGDIMVYVIVYFLSSVVVVGGFSPWLMVPFVLWLVFYIASALYFVPRLARVSQAQSDARSLMTGRVTDAYTNIMTVKLFSHAQREAGFARTAMQDFMVPAYGQMRLVSGVEIINQLLSVGVVGGVIGVALTLWMQGELSAGGAAAATAIALRLGGLSHWVMFELAQLFEHVGTVQDGLNMLSRHHEVTDKVDAKTLHVSQGEIRFEQVNFSYRGTRQVLTDLNLHIPSGQKVGVVGRSGAGKSTLVNLLLRFYDVQSGRITIDGQDIAYVTQDSLRAEIGMVTQEASLLHRSVRDNIVYGQPDASDGQVIDAARRAHAHDFIQTMKDAKGRQAYDAHVGERGVKLSGGQRQRVAIARVMLKDAPILILDEATSALDSEVEVAIQENLQDLMQGKTVVAIAHRLSTIAAMDRLIVLDNGRIVEDGDHATLLQKGGLYARLWAHQSGGFLGEET